MSPDSDDIQVALQEPEEIGVSITPALAVTVTVEAPEVLTTVVGDMPYAVIALEEPVGATAMVAPPPVVTVAAAAPEIMIVAAANVGQPGTVGPFREGHTFAVLGSLAGISALPSFFVPKHASQDVVLVGLFTKLVAGEVSIQIKLNGANVGTPIVVTSAKTYTSLGDIGMDDGDEISAVLSGLVGGPDTLSATVVLEWNVGDVPYVPPPSSAVAGVDGSGPYINTGVADDAGSDGTGIWVETTSDSSLVGVDGTGPWIEG